MISQCTVKGCAQPSRARTWCIKHYERWRRNGDPITVKPRTCWNRGLTPRHDQLVEDVEWLLADHATLDSAAARLGRSPSALTRALYRAGRPDLIAQLNGTTTLTKGA